MVKLYMMTCSTWEEHGVLLFIGRDKKYFAAGTLNDFRVVFKVTPQNLNYIVEASNNVVSYK